jgi:hypothetical protein
MSEQHSERLIPAGARLEHGRSLVVAVLVTGFLLATIVGMTSAASPWLSSSGRQTSIPPFGTDLLALAVAGGLCTLVAMLWVFAPRRSKAKEFPVSVPDAEDDEEIVESIRTGTSVLIGGIVAVLALIAIFWFLLSDSSQPPLQGAPPVAPRPDLPPATGASDSLPHAFHWFVFGLIASVAIILPLALIAYFRQRETEPEEDVLPDSVAQAVRESIDEIERDSDARRSIIRAYARMEQAFGDAGAPRRPYEAPFEYVGRVLRGLHVSPPAAGRLTTLFERARFSDHALGTETQQEAVGALKEIQRQIEVPPA